MGSDQERPGAGGGDGAVDHAGSPGDVGSGAPAAAVPVPPRWERRAVACVLLVYAVFQVNAILHHGSWGQDFTGHLLFTARAYADPWRFATTYAEGQNNPPLFHLYCAAVWKLTNHTHALEVIAAVALALNAGALWLVHRLSLRLIASPALRVAAVATAAFLPVGMIHAVVLAADCLATPAAVAVLYVLVRVVEAGRGPARRFVGWCAVALLALMFAVNIKFTAVALVPGAAVTLLAAGWTGALGRWRTAVALAVVVVLPAVTCARTYRQYRLEQQGNLGITAAIDPWTAELNVRSLLLPRAGDAEVLAAPPYDTPTGARHPDGRPELRLSVRDAHSYWGLLHLGVFTDVLNVYQHDPADAEFGPRGRGPQRRMAVAVKTALPFTAAVVVAVPWMLVVAGRRVWVRRDRRDVALWGVLVVSLALFLVVFAFLPFVGALSGGYWLPRLIVPALFGFVLVVFAGIDRTRAGASRVGGAVVLVAVLAQCGLHLSFLWPWGANATEAPQIQEFVPSDLAVDADLSVRFARRPAGSNDPILVLGRAKAADVVFARYDADGRARVAFNRWGSPGVQTSEPIDVDPSQVHRVRVRTDPAAKTIVVTLDGRDVIRLEGHPALPYFRDEVFVGHNPIAGTVVGERFGGEVVPVKVRVRGGVRWKSVAAAGQASK